MAIKSNNTHGNPYHDENDGRFTSKNVMSAGELETIDDFLASFGEDLGENVAEEPKKSENNSPVDFKPILNKVVTNKKKRDLIIGTLNEQLNALPDNYKNVIFDFLNKTNIPIDIKGQETMFHFESNWLGKIVNCRLFVKQNEILDSNNAKSHMQGTSFIHEIFHAIDFMDSNYSWFSCTQILSNGKTLRETLNDDINALDINKVSSELAQEYVNKRGQRVSDLVNGKILPERVNELIKIQKDNREAMNSELSFINHMYTKGFFAKFEDYVEAFDKKANEYKEKLKPYNEELSLIEIARKQAHRELKDEYSIMSDLCESVSLNNELTKVLNYGHGQKYWNKDYKNQVIEFFAECAESDAINKKSLEKLEKYFPNAVEGFREIMKGLEGGQ